ncbi:UNVERIFIED_CONTAM: hypothetical protein Sradi_0683500 [Sesamum radiatum]|uniref:Uncharacterized protein n=1 Tax=Sesamum radiatum TaxID=300843 RepID=A0AAW2VR76_SESRA
MSGLRSDIQRELVVLCPSSLSQAVCLARLLEAKFTDSKPPSACHLRPTVSGSRQAPLLAPLPPKPPFPICHLSPMEMQEHRAQGLCFNCDDKSLPGIGVRRSSSSCSSPMTLILQVPRRSPPQN